VDTDTLFKNKYHGETCIILGNGPSLTIPLLVQLNTLGIFTFVSNGFILVKNKLDCSINAVCMSNEGAIHKYLRDYPDDTLKFIKKSNSNNYRDLKNVYELPFECEHEKGIHKADYIKDGNFSFNPWDINFCGDTVILDFCLPLAYFMGFKQIFMAGVDCDYSKGYFVEGYELADLPEFKGMINDDFSIALPSYLYVYNLFSESGVSLRRLTKSERLSFIPSCSIDLLLTSSKLTDDYKKPIRRHYSS
jgi:hypothetical protein